MSISPIDSLGPTHLIVEVDDITDVMASVFDQYGKRHDIRTDIRRGKGPLPRVGETWLIDRTLGPWSFAACLDPKVPEVEGEGLGEVAKSLVEALSAMGLILPGDVNFDLPELPDLAYLPLVGGTLSGPLLLPDGTVDLPGVGFSAEPDTGWMRGFADSMEAVVRGAKLLRLRYLASGSYVGPGNTNGEVNLGGASFQWKDFYVSAGIWRSFNPSQTLGLRFSTSPTGSSRLDFTNIDGSGSRLLIRNYSDAGDEQVRITFAPDSPNAEFDIRHFGAPTLLRWMMRSASNHHRFDGDIYATNNLQVLGNLQVGGSVVTTAPLPIENGVQVFTSSGTFVVPAGVTRISVEVVGGGGGGSGGAPSADTSQRSGHGGAAGGYARKLMTVTPGQSFSLVVGGGGAPSSGGSTQAGASGGSSWFGGANILAAGGGNGAPGHAASSRTGGADGTGVGGDVNLVGGGGTLGSRDSSIGRGGQGGASMLSGTTPEALRAWGMDGHPYGGGGGGAGFSGVATHAGGKGADGVVIVRW